MPGTPDYVLDNRTFWDKQASDWVAMGERAWTEEPQWGIWGIPESELALLPKDMAGMRAIELGCGTAYVSAWMARRGARVKLVLGPSSLQPEQEGLEVVRVRSAREMQRAATAEFGQMDAAIFAAAVADYRPAMVADEKIKKGEGSMQLELVRNPDIAAELSGSKKNGQITIGFAMETTDELANARRKLQQKNLDVIVLNSLREPGAGFAHDTNKITLIDHNKQREFELKTKAAVAADIVDDLVARLARSQ